MKRLGFAGAALCALTLFASGANAAEAPANGLKLPGTIAQSAERFDGLSSQPDVSERIVLAQRRARGRRAGRRRSGRRVVRRGRRRGRRGRRIAGGIAAGVIAAIIASEIARADRRGWRPRCRRWYRQCDYGNSRACRLFYRYC